MATIMMSHKEEVSAALGELHLVLKQYHFSMNRILVAKWLKDCLLYTSDAADE